MAQVRVNERGDVTAVFIDGVDITPHILAEPTPTLAVTGDGATDLHAVDIRLMLEKAPEIADPGTVCGCSPDPMIDVLVKVLNDLRREIKETRHELHLFKAAVNGRDKSASQKARAGR